MTDDGYWTYAEWDKHTVGKIVSMGLRLQEAVRADWLTLQIKLAIQQALRHGRSGLGDNDPVTP